MRPRFAAARPRAWAGGAIAAMLVLGVVGAEQIHARHDREQQAAQQQAAQQQFDVAMRVTDQALAQTREQLERAGLKLGD